MLQKSHREYCVTNGSFHRKTVSFGAFRRVNSLLQCVVLIQLYRRVVRVQAVVSALLVIVATVVFVGHHDVTRCRGWLSCRTFGGRCVHQLFHQGVLFAIPLLMVQLNQPGQIERFPDGGRLASLDRFTVDQMPVQIMVEKLRWYFASVC